MLFTSGFLHFPKINKMIFTPQIVTSLSHSVFIIKIEWFPELISKTFDLAPTPNMQNYYPWSTKALLDWLRQELDHYDKQTLASKLKVPRHVLQTWLSEAAPTITMAHIRAIAQYRDWNLNQVIDWLKIQPAHLQELMHQDTYTANQKRF